MLGNNLFVFLVNFPPAIKNTSSDLTLVAGNDHNFLTTLDNEYDLTSTIQVDLHQDLQLALIYSDLVHI